MIQPAFYDHTLSYDDNYEKGPPINFQNLTPPQRQITKKQKFLGYDVNIPFGIPPGPLLNSKFIKSAFAWGYDVLGYKTVRSQNFPCHPFPNVLFVQTNGDLHPEENKSLLGTTESNSEEFSITNSFGVPSKDPIVWQEDVSKALSYEGEGQLMILSFMGTVKQNQSPKEFVNDFVLAAELAQQTKAKVLEANLSCPNIGNEGLVCYDLEISERICQEIRRQIGSSPLIIKVGYYKNPKDLEKIAEIASRYADGIALINAIQNKVVNKDGDQALPGNNRLVSGIAGSSIKWAGIEMTKNLSAIRIQKKYSFEIMSMGGVFSADDYNAYRDAGADCVMSATGTMWNPYLANEIYTSTNT